MLVPSFSRTKFHRDRSVFNDAMVGAQVIQNVRSMKENRDSLVFEDDRGMT